MDDVVLSHNNYFYKESIKLKIHTRKEGKIYFTLNGETPTDKSNPYSPENGIDLMASTTDDPKVHTVHAIVYYNDGTKSDEIIHSYVIGKTVDSRYENLLIF